MMQTRGSKSKKSWAQPLLPVSKRLAAGCGPPRTPCVAICCKPKFCRKHLFFNNNIIIGLYISA
jgi:hypothetical protein